MARMAERANALKDFKRDPAVLEGCGDFRAIADEEYGLPDALAGRPRTEV
jgi:hypothetical protein